MSMVRPRPMPPFPKPAKPESRKRTGFSISRRQGLRQVSVKKAHWRKLYLGGLRFLVALDPLCRRCQRRRAIEGHHPWGQLGALILLFFPICRTCHDEIENNKKKARAEGWILYK